MAAVSPRDAVVAAAQAMVADWRDTSGSIVRIDWAMHEHCEAIARAVEALAAAEAARVA